MSRLSLHAVEPGEPAPPTLAEDAVRLFAEAAAARDAATSELIAGLARWAEKAAALAAVPGALPCVSDIAARMGHDQARLAEQHERRGS